MMLAYIIVSLIIFGFVLMYKSYLNYQKKKQKKKIQIWRNYFTQDPVQPLSQGAIEAFDNYREFMSFVTVMREQKLNPENKEKIQAFIHLNKPAWLEIGKNYSKKSIVVRSYYAWFCKEIEINQPGEYDEMTEMMLTYLFYPSFYCRENSLRALYVFGNEAAVIEAFKQLSKAEIEHNSKIIYDGLLTFTGDKRKLANLLFENFDFFTLDYQVAIIDYFRMEGAHLKYQLIEPLKDQALNKEIVCALMRYYKKYPVLEYKAVILSWFTPANRYRWEILAVTASTLAEYPGEDTIKCLKPGLDATNWFIRKNTAIALKQLQVDERAVEKHLDQENLKEIDRLTYYLASKEHE